jgi:hypothetical protein
MAAMPMPSVIIPPAAVEKAVRTMFVNLEKSRMVLGVVDDNYEQAAPPPQPVATAANPLVRPRTPKLLLSFGVAQISLLWLVRQCCLRCPLPAIVPTKPRCQWACRQRLRRPAPSYLLPAVYTTALLC